MLPSKTSDASITYTFTGSITPIGNSVFADTSGTAFDTLDRPAAKYQFINDAPKAETFTYDTSPDFGDLDGLLVEHCNAVSQCGIPNYDAADREIHIQYSDSTPTEDTAYDADGHVLSVTSSTFGVQSYTYDADGKMVVSTDPNKSGSGITGGATQVTHNYYPDGMLASIDVNAPNATMNGSAFSETGLFQYSYRNDGKLQTQAIDLPQNAKVATTTLAFSYTSGGRQTQRAESGTGANATGETFSYGAVNGTVDGAMTSSVFPGGNVSVSAYDAEGNVTAYTPTELGTSEGTYDYTYTDRGEMKFESADGTSGVTPAFANGLTLSLPKYVAAEAPQTLTWDARRAVQVASSTGNSNTTSEYGSGQFTYDDAGRQTEDSNSNTSVTLCSFNGSDYNTITQTTTSTTRSYDAEDHIIAGQWNDTYEREYGKSCGELTTAGSVALGYDWGPNGHPIRVGASTEAISTPGPATPGPISYDTLHWDGDQILFTTNSSGAIDDIKIGSIGDVTPLDSGFTGLTFWDRLFGKTFYCHNNTGAGGDGESASLFPNLPDPGCWPYVTGAVSRPTSFAWNAGTASGGVTLNNEEVGQGGLLATPRADGFTDGFNVIQGVRSMDPNQGTWTTPDAYAGLVKDPMSQKAYMWTNDNPVMYSDPSGFLSTEQQDMLGDAVFGLQFLFPIRSSEACSNFILDLYRTVLNIDIRSEVRHDMIAHFGGYNLHGWSNGNFAGDVRNMHAFFDHTSQLHGFTKGSSQVGDILFLSNKNGEDLHHVAMVSAVDASGNPSQVVEATGSEITVKSWSQFSAAMANQGIEVNSVGRDDADSSSHSQGQSLFYDSGSGRPL